MSSYRDPHFKWVNIIMSENLSSDFTFCPWSLDLSFNVPYQLPWEYTVVLSGWRWKLIVYFAKLCPTKTHLHLHEMKQIKVNQQVACDIVLFKTHHYIIFVVRPPHSNISREWRVIVDLVQTNYHGRPIVLLSVRCDRAVDYDGSSLWSDVELYILGCGKKPGLRPRSFPQLRM